jgi:hypothetical protein
VHLQLYSLRTKEFEGKLPHTYTSFQVLPFSVEGEDKLVVEHLQLRKKQSAGFRKRKRKYIVVSAQATQWRRAGVVFS